MDSRLPLSNLKPPDSVEEMHQRAQRAEGERLRERVFIKNVSVGTSSTPVDHGQRRVPKGFHATPHSNVTVYRAAEPDLSHVYVRASSACTADIEVVF